MIASLAAWSMRHARHHTLIFHRVLQRQDPMSPGEPTAAWFGQLMQMLAARFEMIPLSEAVSRSRQGTLSGRTLSVTFDDGYADNFLVALPILQALDIPATFFVASGFLDGGRMWNDTIIETIRRLPDGELDAGLPGQRVFALQDWASRREAAGAIIAAWKHLHPVDRQQNVDALAARVDSLPDDLMMSTAQLRSLAAAPGATIGGHTVTHPILASLDAAAARREIGDGKGDLEERLGQTLTLFAYPNGRREHDYRAEHAEIVRDLGFEAAVATDWGTLDRTSDVYAIPRFTPWHTNLARFSIDLARCHHGLI